KQAATNQAFVGSEPARDQDCGIKKRGDAGRAQARSYESGNPKNARALVLVCAATASTVWPRSRATSAQMCARYIGSLRRWLGCGRTVRGNKYGASVSSSR